MSADSSPNRSSGASRGCLAFFTAAAVAYYLLSGFVPLTLAVAFALLGAGLVYGGASLMVASAPHVLQSPWYAGSFLAGFLLLAGAAATLLPGAPGELLATSATGWEILELRAARLSDAIVDGNVGLAHKIANRGLGDPAVRGPSGTPLLHLARDLEMVDALLAAGLDPDARDREGQTLLMKSADLEIGRRLLAAGADPNARTRNGSTPLMMRGDDGPAMLELLLEAGADVHAVNHGGRTVADLVRGPGRWLLEAYAGNRPLEETGGATPEGRADWLVEESDRAEKAPEAVISVRPEVLHPGDTGTLTFLLANRGAEDRLLELRAVLNDALLFVGASHGGDVEKLGSPGPSGSVRWPLLSLPAGRRGRLELEVVALSDRALPDQTPGELSADLRVVDLPDRTEEVLTFYQPPAPLADPGEPSGPSLVFPFLVLLGLALGLAILWWSSRGLSPNRRRYRFGRAVASGAALLCAAIAGAMLASVAEPFLRFDAASCRVLDHRVATREITTSGGSETAAVRHSTYGVPLAAVQIETGEERVIATGFTTGATSRSVQDLRGLPIGAEATCWIDPENPRRFTLVRGLSMRGFVGFALLAGVACVLALIAVWPAGNATESPR